MSAANDNEIFPWPAQFTAGPCCDCGWPLSVVDGEPAPTPGSLTLCSECASLNVFTGDMTLRKPTIEECQHAASDPDVAALKDAILRTNAIVKKMARCST